MKAAPFAYARPSTVEEAVAELAGSDGEGKVLAGGQSLVPMLAMRLARPALLVDINAVTGLDVLSLRDGTLHVGAAVRQRRAERDEIAASVPLLGMALPWVGHRELRSRGTVCGSLAHADPAAELPAVAACLDAALEVTGPDGRRTLRARDFFTGTLTTLLGPADLLTGARFPAAGSGEGFGFAEVARRHGDFALAGVAVRVRASPREAVLAAFGTSDRPVVRDVTDLLDNALHEVGREDDAERLAGALAGPASGLAAEIVDTAGDMHASVGYRRRLVATLAARELSRAWVRAIRTDGSTGRDHRPTARPSGRCYGEHHSGNSGGSGGSPPRASTARLTVNGTPVVLRLPPRVTLADALREHLGLTGTHLGCEHGICGMCTVLVNGEAARSCLLLACQLDGAEVLTVEGLGRPGDLHPLQEAFGRHHALQCGFCTPGFLLSAYDLLTHNPGVRRDELPAELSGVLCRCTGYRNILAAVGEVAEAHAASGVPGPRNCGPRALAGRPRAGAAVTGSGVLPAGGAVPETGPAPGGYAPDGGRERPGEPPGGGRQPAPPGTLKPAAAAVAARLRDLLRRLAR